MRPAQGRRSLAAPPGASGKKWEFKTKGNGIVKVKLKNLAPRRPGQFEIQVKTKRWFTATDADQPAASTLLSVGIGPHCFSQVVTKKID